MMSQFERFGKYILLEKLAAGGMAEIYLAKSLGAQGVNKFLAVKRILPQFCENPEFKEMFREEAKLSVNLRHSNVVPIFDFGEERNQFYIVMDYVEGRNLRQILNELKRQQIQFSVEQIAYVVREAAAGLDHAHRCIDGSTGRPLNIIHRDISPQNVMISFDGEVKIIDFGIAKAETQLEATKAGTLKGKFGYMSPEQADGQNIDVRTDIFSLGIVLWELLANDRLFTASSEAAILRKIRDCQVPSIRKINPNVPPELEKIVNKVLAKDPNLRYQTAAALHKDLNRFLNTQFPDFNSQDFAVFIKNAFAQSYQESKRKLVEYAKVQNAEDKTVVTSPAPANTAARTEATVIDHSVPPIGEDGQPLNQETNHKVDLAGLKGGQTRTNISTPSSFTPNPKTKTGIRPGAAPSRGLP
nr:serine/threonine-protein kinase [Pseudobdellovibrionaceae bacterium]